jgi:hypothetical protein
MVRSDAFESIELIESWRDRVPAPFYRFQTSTSVIARCFLHVYHDAGHWRANVQNITTPRLTESVRDHNGQQLLSPLICRTHGSARSCCQNA